MKKSLNSNSKEVLAKVKFDKFNADSVQLSQRGGLYYEWQTENFDHPFFKESGYVEVKMLVDEENVVEEIEVIQELKEDNIINFTNYVRLLRGISSLVGVNVDTIFGMYEVKGIMDEDDEYVVLLENDEEDEFTVKVFEWRSILS